MCDEGNATEGTEVCQNPNCKRQYIKAKGRRGLCGRCATYMQRHGVLRPALLAQDKRTCANPHCDRDISRRSQRGNGTLCKRCYRYAKAHGTHWKPEVGRRSPNTTPPVCSQCKRRTARYTKPKPQCRLCFDFWKRTGKFRPRTLDAEQCKICGRPRLYEPKEFVKGRCRQCYAYWWNSGKRRERPEHLWQRGKYGYCECSAPATHKTTIRIHGHLEDLPLCDACYAIEQQHRAWYGDGKPTGNLQQGKRLDVYGDD